MADALRLRLTTLARLQRLLDHAGGKGRRGSKLLRSLLDLVDDRPVESVIELKLLGLLRRTKLPSPVTQFNVTENGQVIARVDFAYPEIRLAIEADGYRYHGARNAWERDLKRRNALTARGWHVIHVTWDDIAHRPTEVVKQIRRAIENLTGTATFFPL